MNTISRREALSRVTILLGGAVVGGNLFLQTGCASSQNVNKLFTQADIDLLTEIAETIFPETAGSPGAKAADVGNFIAMMVLDCYDEQQQKIFTEGMRKLMTEAKHTDHKEFMEMRPVERYSFLTRLNTEQEIYTTNKKSTDPPHYFRMMKELTLLGFFSSEIGCTKALRYVAVPGRYEAVIPYQKGDRAWA